MRVMRRVFLAGGLLLLAGCSDPAIGIWVRNQSSQDVVIDFVQESSPVDIHGAQLVPAGAEGMAVTITGPRRGLAILYVAELCDLIESVAAHEGTPVVTVTPALGLVTREGVDLAGLSGIELEWTDRCLPSPPR